MKDRGTTTTSSFTTVMPTTLPPVPSWMSSILDVKKPRTFTVEFSTGQYQVNGRLFTGVAQEMVNLDTVSQWSIFEDDPMNHPYHQHINHFQIESFPGQDQPINLTGLQVGMWRDTIQISDTAIVVRWKAHAFPGRMLFHCHLALHTDRGMMAMVNITGDYEPYQPQKVPTLNYANCSTITHRQSQPPPSPSSPPLPPPSPGTVDDRPSHPPGPLHQHYPTASHQSYHFVAYGIAFFLIVIGFGLGYLYFTL
eukprot:TRINITY_DN5317_c0_g1_i2.p1 TRINITY_DN5317_c0_g1~~TRINITY_DN5317_c0_g1_i2.p1  ORF type:complete len:252 (-),score=49.57 TRINITY_DN5317_c0_g1_i2:243-998(-)